MQVRAGIMNEDDVLVDHRFWQIRVSPTASETCSLKTSHKSQGIPCVGQPASHSLPSLVHYLSIHVLPCVLDTLRAA